MQGSSRQGTGRYGPAQSPHRSQRTRRFSVESCCVMLVTAYVRVAWPAGQGGDWCMYRAVCCTLIYLGIPAGSIADVEVHLCRPKARRSRSGNPRPPCGVPLTLDGHCHATGYVLTAPPAHHSHLHNDMLLMGLLFRSRAPCLTRSTRADCARSTRRCSAAWSLVSPP